MTRRTDVHRPTEVVPADYEYVAPEYLKIENLGDAHALMFYREQIKAHMARTGGTYATHDHGGNCGICGNVHALYTILFYHEPTNSYVRVGSRCATELDMRFDDRAVKGMKRIIAKARERQRGKAKAKATLEDEGLQRCWEIYETSPHRPTDDNEVTGGSLAWKRIRDLETITDIVGKLVKYGSISEKQTDFLRSLLDRLDRAEEIAAEREAERKEADPCPEGRVTIEGEVLKVEVRDNAYGSRLVMTVKADEGFLVWGTCPRAIDPDRGDRIRFDAQVKPSDRDEKFGFFKRPTKAEIL